MALFFSRRTYNAPKKKFTLKPAAKTRYVHITQQSPGGKIRKGSIVKRAKWLDLVRQEGGDSAVLIYVHGFNTSQKDMLDRLGKIETNLRGNGYQGAVVAFDWPSDGSVHTYDSDRSDAKAVAPHLVGDGILPLLGMSPRPKVHLIAHSMGALVVLRAFSDFGDSAGPGNKIWSADQVMFASADIDSEWLEKGAWGDLVLKKRCKRFTNYYSRKDKVLALAGGIVHGGRRRAGRVGMPKLTSKGHWDIFCDHQYQRDVPKGQRKMMKSHRWWFDSGGFYEDLALTIDGHSEKTMPTRHKTNIGDLALLA
ncbi:alpha/beta fold hydrolase [Ruegeria sp. HKCCD6428]|uniref:alpha/beta fold hydrolase n=1 Tax=Ruegeria sp. HKCCD6428 TaxID=2683002 RepID=UPI0014917BA9|nr:alpha/beta fold hydrolase [Ruegeria sp. HKCCD6428]NOC83773.1 alpha/beta fold hydrolase [Ruegeria sp. HKCCD6428]